MIKTTLSAVAVLAALTGAAFAEGDAEKGSKVFNKCKACHAVGEGAKNKVGPQLNGILGRAAATDADFKYSDGMKTKGAEGLVWDAATMAAFLAKPKDVVPGTKMSFAGLKKDDEIANVIAYLATFQ